ncbi:hypothetical protein B1H58_13225 [Pantoea alhagi]|uniref:Uncharacterized protein n=1 Tax=Pantoea alhagi TaxID=1891675 RepID=A0A1W6B736_9GAMM|nr:hypothetical protein [Pantoea alhagi]ARJ42891.1 hypothetical protein B1H58_13225 [Pantoea alhagi]
MPFIARGALLLSLLVNVIPATVANPLKHVNPMTDCLNGHILPQMGSNEAPEAIVNHAFLLCKPFIDSWLASYPDARRQQLGQALRQFYLDRLYAALNSPVR